MLFTLLTKNRKIYVKYLLDKLYNKYYYIYYMDGCRNMAIHAAEG